MELVEFAAGSKPPLTFPSTGVQPLVKSTLKNFSDATTPHCMASTRKYTVYNKSPTVAKVLQRVSGKGADLELPGNVLQISSLHYDSDQFVAVLDNGEVVFLKTAEQPDSSLSFSIVDSHIVLGAARVVVSQRPGTVHNPQDPRQHKVVLAFARNGAVQLIGTDGVKKLADIGELPGAVAGGSGLVVFARKNKVSVRSADNFGDEVLSKAWLPHGDDACTAVHVFDRAGPEGNVMLLTAAGNEVRLWSLAKGSVSLHQTVSVIGEDPRSVHVDSNSAYVCLFSKSTVIVCELAEKSFVAHRITEWALGDDIVSASLTYRKVQSNGTTRTDFNVIVRNGGGVQRNTFDAERLEGAPNVGEATSSASQEPANNDSVKKWFANATPVPAAAAPPTVTQITSTVGGSRTVQQSVDASALAATVSEQQRMFAEQLAQLDAAVVALEHRANENLSIFRGTGSAATAAGQAAARQHAAMVFNGMKSGGAANLNFTVNTEVLDGFTDAVRSAASVTVQHALANGLKHHAGNAADRASTIVANAMDKDSGMTLPKVTTLPSMQALLEAIDKGHAQQNELFRRQKEQDNAKYRNIVRAAQEKSTKASASVKEYLDRVRGEIADTKKDIAAVNNTDIPAAAPEDTEDSIYAAAMQAAEQGRWRESLLKVTGPGRVPVVLRFLDADFVRSNRSSVCNADVVDFPVFLALVQQLTSDLVTNTGLIPTRVEWLYEFVIAFDHKISSPVGPDQAFIESHRIQFSNALDAINAVDALKGSVDRQTRRQVTVCKKVLGPLGM